MTSRTEINGAPGADTTSLDAGADVPEGGADAANDGETLAPLDADLFAFVSAARHALDASIAANAPTPDAAAALRLAHVLDDVAVPASWVERAELETNVVPLQRRSTADADALAPFVEALRASVDEAALERRLAGIPELTGHTSTRAPDRRDRSNTRRVLTWAIGVAAVIAVAAFASSLGGVSRLGDTDPAVTETTAMGSLGHPQADPRTPDAGFVRIPSAPVGGRPSSPGHGQTTPADASAVHVPANDATSLAHADDASGGPTSVAPPTALDSVAPSPAHRRVQRARTQASSTVAAMEGHEPDVTMDSASSSLDDRLRALEAEASTAWREGQLDEAAAALERIIDLGGTRPRVEAAYADLFAITRQRSSGATRERELASLWSRYLERFPRGRHADDARAGLCRVAPSSERDTCWREYLERHPDGEHVDAAQRALGVAEAPPG